MLQRHSKYGGNSSERRARTGFGINMSFINSPRPHVLRSKQSKFSVSDSETVNYFEPSLLVKAFSKISNNNPQNIYWSKYEPKNFGDWITPYLFYRITKRPICFQRPSRRSATILSAGSIFRHIKVADSAIVWGSGIISKEDKFEQPKDILAVRGTKTRDHLIRQGIKCPNVFGDPGILLPYVYQPKNIEKKYALGIIPHFAEAHEISRFQNLLDKSDIKVIDVTQPIETVINDIVSCEATVSSSLHGIIVSHAYGIKSGWIRFSKNNNSKIAGDDIKYYDYFSAFGCDEKISCMEILEAKPNVAAAMLAHAANTPLPDIAPVAEILFSTCPFE